ncbi:MAG: nucleotide sugar dehydrogenase [Desulfarculaceae bacterium]
MRISVFGLGYVGATSTACLAELGHQVVGVDVNPDKAGLINQGLSPVFEPGVDDLVAKHLQAGRIRATTDANEALEFSEACLICVGTPSNRHGLVDDSALRKVMGQIASARAQSGRIQPVLVRSTALPHVHGDLMAQTEDSLAGQQPLAYCVHPEFLRAGKGIFDFMNPPKIVFGCSDAEAQAACRELYPDFAMEPIFTDPMTAAMIKYADNCFHALKVTFANEMGMICKSSGVDSRRVLEIFCQDNKLNLSPYYLKPGFAFGGSCLPKDLKAVLGWGRQEMVTLPMLENILPSNQLQIAQLISRILDGEVKSVGMFGLAFKEDTDDLRESPLVALAENLAGKGKFLSIYDPNLAVPRMVGTNLSFALEALPHLAEMLVDDPVQVVEDSDVVVLARDFVEVEWAQLPWRDDQRVFDISHQGDFSGVGGRREGLYW